MKISELIEALQDYQAEQGDNEILVVDDNYNDYDLRIEAHEDLTFIVSPNY
jgi:hypothetical protein